MNYRNKYIKAMIFLVAATVSAVICAAAKEAAENRYVSRVEADTAKAAYETAYGLRVIKGLLPENIQAAELTAGQLKGAAAGLPLSAQASKRLHRLLYSIENGEAGEADVIYLTALTEELDKRGIKKAPAEIVNCIEEVTAEEAENGYAIAENREAASHTDERLQNEFKKAAKRILDTRTKLKISPDSPGEKLIICYCRNLYLEIDRVSQTPYFFVREYTAGEPVLDGDTCGIIAKTYTLRNLPRHIRGSGAEVKITSISDSEAGAEVYLGEKTVRLRIRRDTGRAVYYDASDLF